MQAMRRAIWFMLLLTGFVACRQKIEPGAALVGTWRWLQSTGSLDGHSETPATVGYELRLQIDDAYIARYRNDSLLVRERYRLVKGQSIYSSEEVLLLRYSDGRQQSFMVAADTLVLRDECYDCFVHVYVRE